MLGLAVSANHDLELVDPDGSLPTLWFQPTAPHDEPRHASRRRPGASEVAPGQVEAALAAGGRLVSDERAPTFWVLADAEGNRACVTTWQGRDGQG